MERSTTRPTSIRVTLSIKINLPDLNFIESVAKATGLTIEEVVSMQIEEHCQIEEAIRKNIAIDLEHSPPMFTDDTPSKPDCNDLSDEALAILDNQKRKVAEKLNKE